MILASASLNDVSQPWKLEVQFYDSTVFLCNGILLCESKKGTSIILAHNFASC